MISCFNGTVLFYSLLSNIFFLQTDKLELALTVEAHNLSEDMTRISSMNDEILLLIYNKDTSQLNTPVLSQRVDLDTANRKVVISESIISQSDHYILFVLEQDSDSGVERIDPIIRIYYQEIIQAYEDKNYLEIEKYLGDDDLLGYVEFHSEPLKELKSQITGIYKMDRYDYSIGIKLDRL